MLSIGPVVSGDLPHLASCYTRAYNPLGIGEHWTPDSAQNLMAYFFREQADLFFAAKEGGTIVGGTVAMVKPWWDGNHLIDGEIFVDPGYQKQGIGPRLLKTLFAAAKTKYNARSWDTYTHIVHSHPLSWYKKLGFTTIEHWQMISGDVDTVLTRLQR
ncbi:GNAT family N-acetyltransferase [Patescibacteria group bacterium]|nr:GNAT family N-acetyltransferase [Patescibacteria group bacterium]